eukprot:TRINITY_DN966_c0_g2_i1.p1 TRINITY_DN966_c0_g2~~TRINITY_DN966_c0_g2_i1.p1  ORF type:complete len:485 (+),score=83.17 TRINITY_DN966_c0_g2_i1:165-1619(+)
MMGLSSSLLLILILHLFWLSESSSFSKKSFSDFTKSQSSTSNPLHPFDPSNLSPLPLEFRLSGFFPVESETNGYLILSSFLLGIQDANKYFHDNLTLPVRLVGLWNDSSCNTGKALVGLTEHDPTSLIGVIGGGCGEVTLSLCQLSQYYNLTVVSSGASSLVITQPASHPNLLRLVPAYAKLVLTWISLCQNFYWDRISIIYSDDPTMLVLSHYFIEKAVASNITVVTESMFYSGSFDPSLEQIVDAKSKIIFVCASSIDGATILEQASKYGLLEAGHAWIGLDTWVDDVTVNFSTPGLLSIVPYIKTPSPPSFDPYTERLKNKCSDLFGNDPKCVPKLSSPNHVYTYDSVMLFAYAIRDSFATLKSNPMKNLTRFGETLFEMRFDGLSGSISFLSSGEREFTSWKVMNKQLAFNNWVHVGTFNESNTFSQHSPILWPGPSPDVPSSGLPLFFSFSLSLSLSLSLFSLFLLSLSLFLICFGSPF